MRPASFVLIPVFAAALGLTLATAPAVAQDSHDHAASGCCAHCQHSGSTAAVHTHTPPALDQTDGVDGDPVEHPPDHAATRTGEASSCRGAMKHVAQSGTACAHMNHDAAGACCAHMATGHAGVDQTPAPPPDASRFAMPGKAGCDATTTTDRGKTDAPADDPSVTE